MTVLTINTTGVQTKEWIADKDYVLVGYSASGNTFTFSTDPSMTTANNTVPAGVFLNSSLLFQHTTAVNCGLRGEMKIPIVKGTNYYLASSAAVGVQLFLDDVVS